MSASPKPVSSNASPTSNANGEAAVHGLKILDTPPEATFDLALELARAAAGCPAALISFTDGGRQWCKARLGFPHAQSAVEDALCAQVVTTKAWVEITDAGRDARSTTSRWVLEAPHVAAYLGAPITVNGATVGAVSVLDWKPRRFDEAARQALRACAELAANLLEQRARASFLSELFDNSADAVLAVDAQQRISHWNAASETMFGYSAVEALGQPLHMIIPPRFRQAHDAGFARRCATGEARWASAVRVAALRRDGSEFPADLSVSVCRGPTTIAGAIIRDVTERDAMAAARDESLAKSRFLANMSHEIRTPLNGILGLGHVLSRTALDHEQHSLLSTMNSAAEALKTLLTDVLDLARFDSGVITIACEAFDLGGLLDEVAALYQPVAEAKGLAYQWTRLPRTWVLGDAPRLKQILGNLLSNAVKFTAAGQVVLTAEQGQDTWRFEVRDTGMGFDQAMAERLFGRFVQADDSVTRTYGGSGLGLAIAREIATALGGGVSGQATPGEGAIFTVELPLTCVAPPASSRAEKGALDAPSVRLLLAEDHPVNRQVVELILAPLGLRIDAVENGKLALEAAQTGEYDLILMDMQMPVMDGLTATREIRRHEQITARPRCPLIMLTANAMPEHLLASFEAGADEHLCKPLNPAVLIEAIVSALAGPVAIGGDGSARLEAQPEVRDLPATG